jgi:PAS domain S-box-containing protein
VTESPLALCDAASCALFALDEKTRILFANRAALSLLGAVPSRVVGTPFLDHVDERHREMVSEALGPRAFSLEASLLDKDGHAVATFLRGELSETGWSIVAEDRAIELELRSQLANAREATEFQLARAIEMSNRNKELMAALDGEATLSTRAFRTEEGLERALRSAGLATWHWDVALGGVTLRGAYEAYFGFKPENMIEIREGIAPEDRDALWKAAERARRDKVPMDLRVHIKSRDGVTRLVRVAGVPRENLRGEVAGVDGSLVDESERERTRTDLEHFDQELRVLIEGMSDGVAFIGRDWRLRYVNRKGAELIGKRPGELGGVSVRDLFPGGAGESFRRAHRKVMNDRIPVEIEDRYDPLGRTFVNRIYPADDGIAVFFQDVTEWRRREERLRFSEQRLRELGARMQVAREEEAKRIAREIHDDLGQALTVLKMDLARLRTRAAADPALAEPIAQMDGVIDGAVATTRRIAADLRPAILDDLGLAAAIAWHAEQVSARAGFEATVDVPKNDVSVDAAGSIVLYRVLQEALTNVARHAKATHVTIKLRERAPLVTLEIKDDGRGFDPEAPTRSFGLLGMRERTASVGGLLDVDSAPGRGTLVRAQVPRKLSFDASPTQPDEMDERRLP